MMLIGTVWLPAALLACRALCGLPTPPNDVQSRDAPAAKESAPAATASGAPRFVLEAPAVAAGEQSADSEARLAESADDLIRRAESAGDHATARAAALRAASFLLGRCCEPPLSRVLLDIHSPRDGDDLVRFAAKAAALTKPIADQPSPDSRPAEPPKPAEDVGLLTAVATACEAIGRGASQPAPTEDVRAALLEAGSGVAAYLDDPRPAVAQLARLLQAVCYRRGARPERTIEVLELMADGPGQAPYEVFDRMEHCRALVDHGQVIAALAMSIRWETAIPPRVPVEHRTAAAHAFRALRWRIMDDWSRQLRSREETDAAARAAEHAERLRLSLAAAGPVALYRLGSLLPEGDEPPRRNQPVNR